MKHMTT